MTNCAHHKTTFAACLLFLSAWAAGGEGGNGEAEVPPSSQVTDVVAPLPINAVQRRKRFLDSHVIEYRFAKYLSECCVAKLESVGSAMYPEEARGKLYGTVLVLLEQFRPDLLKDGELGRGDGDLTVVK